MAGKNKEIQCSFREINKHICAVQTQCYAIKEGNQVQRQNEASINGSHIYNL